MAGGEGDASEVAVIVKRKDNKGRTPGMFRAEKGLCCTKTSSYATARLAPSCQLHARAFLTTRERPQNAQPCCSTRSTAAINWFLQAAQSSKGARRAGCESCTHRHDVLRGGLRKRASRKDARVGARGEGGGMRKV